MQINLQSNQNDKQENAVNKVGHWITAFETHLVTEKRVANNTFLDYKRDIDQFQAFLHTRKQSLESCTKAHIKNFLKKLKHDGLKARSLSRKISSLKLLFNYLHENYGVVNRAEGLISPKLEKYLPIYLTETEIETLFKVANRDATPRGMRNKMLLTILYATGMRISELLSLTLHQIHFDTGFINIVGKGNKERSIPLPQKILSVLRHYLDKDYVLLLPAKTKEYVIKHIFVSFYKGAARPITRQSCWIFLKKLLVKASINKNVSPHTLRHSLATHLLKNGANLRALQLLLGHENLSTVQIYTHLETSQMRKIYDDKHPRS